MTQMSYNNHTDMLLLVIPDPCYNGGRKPLMCKVDAALSKVAMATEIKALKVKSDCGIKELYTDSPPLHRDMLGIWQGSMSMILLEQG